MNSARMIKIPTMVPATMKEVAIVLRSSKAWPVGESESRQRVDHVLRKRCTADLSLLSKTVVGLSKFSYFGRVGDATPTDSRHTDLIS